MAIGEMEVSPLVSSNVGTSLNSIEGFNRKIMETSLINGPLNYVKLMNHYPLAMTKIAVENDPVKIVSSPVKMVIFHTYISLPQGGAPVRER